MPSTPSVKGINKNEIDAVEDLLLDDFSFSDGSEAASDEGDEMSRTSSIDSISSHFSIRRQIGKQLLKNHTNGCLETLSIKMDQLVMQFEQNSLSN